AGVGGAAAGAGARRPAARRGPAGGGWLSDSGGAALDHQLVRSPASRRSPSHRGSRTGTAQQPFRRAAGGCAACGGGGGGPGPRGVVSPRKLFPGPPPGGAPAGGGGARFCRPPRGRGEGACYFDATRVSRQARANRELLARVLRGAGLVNYPTEWWHWSCGDRYWALVTGAPAALYGPVAADQVV